MREDETTYPFWLGEPDAEDFCRIGLSETFLETFEGEPVGVELARAGTRLAAGDGLGFLHLPKKTVDLRAPCALEIIQHNSEVLANPPLARLASYGRGWLALVKVL